MPTRSVHYHRPPAAPEATINLVGGLPKDQALGLRLIAFARAAAAMHMAESAMLSADRIETVSLAGTQAADLVREMRP